MAKIEPSGNAGKNGRTDLLVSALVAEKLGCQRGGRLILSGLSFEVCASSALILRGPNGSGKTTLLRTIAGFLQPARGSVRVLFDGSRQASKGVTSEDNAFHYIGHANGIKSRLSVLENIQFWQRYYGGRGDLETAEAALDAFDLLDLADYRAAYLSQGQGRRLGLARLLAAPRPVWLLDEPATSLDASSAHLFEGVLAKHLHHGGLAIVATHSAIAVSGAACLELGSMPTPQ